jgi:diguanylate cyclase (GGDEF)-like protein
MLAVAFAGEILSHGGGRQTVVWVDDVGTFVAAFGAAIACVVAAWRGDRRDRAGWAVLALGLLAWSFGEAMWAIYELGTGSVPFPSAADAGYLLAVPIVATGLLLFPSSGRLIARTRSVLDGLVVGGALLVVSWVTVLGGVYRSGSGSAIDQAITLAYPLGDVVTGTIVLTVLARHRWRWGNPLVLVGTGLAVMALSDSLYAWLAQTNSYGTGNPIDIGYVVAYLLLALAALRADATSTPAAPGRQRSTEHDLGALPLQGVLLPYVTVAVAFGAWLAAVATGARDDTVLLVTGWGVMGLVLLRQFATLLENRRLNTTLVAKVAELAGREEELERLAFHDPLTGLPNRTLFLRRVEDAFRSPGGTPPAVMFVDVDDFKTVNDSLGHEAGDELLVLVAERIARCVRAEDTAARLGGDEFGVVLSDLGARAPTPSVVAARILDVMRRPFDLAGRDVSVRVSIGIAHGERDDTGVAELLRQADTAMYAAKNRGKGCYEVFEPRMTLDVVRRLDLQASLARALSTDQLELHYQPIVDFDTGRVFGAEALARWTHPELGPIAPSEFVAVAEHSGLIHDLGRWALLRACEEAARWPTSDGSAPVVSVNLSVVQLHDSAIVDTVAEALHVAGLPPDRLVLEITESVLMRHTERTVGRLRSLRAIGVRLAIDDFGTGYSSLSYLPRFPVDIIKIDQAFLRSPPDPAGLAVVRGIIELAKSLGLRTVGEGVETEEQALVLRGLGCTAGQGFWFSPPVPAGELSWSDLPAPAGIAEATDVPSPD